MEVIRLDELHAFHKLDRDVFSRMVIDLSRNPGESLLVMALWLWLEKKNSHNIMVRMQKESDFMVNAIANEAVSCLNCLSSRNFFCPSTENLLYTSSVLGKDLSLRFFYHNKHTVICEIKILLKNICARAFTDILQRILMGSTTFVMDMPLKIPGFPHPTFGNINVVPRSRDYLIPIGGISNWLPTSEVPPDDRTLFLTFSRGFPVSEIEVRELFTTIYGNCVESVELGDVTSDEEPMYAKMVLPSLSAIDYILKGRTIAKFQINGKHVWARKYERRR